MAVLAAVEHALSSARLEPYVKAAGGSLEEGLALYEWNTAISGALFEVLQHLEVGLRNTIDRELAALFEQPDWWHSPRLRLVASGQDMISKATAETARRRTGGNVGHVVAALPFGFWVGLVSAGRDCNYEMTLWRPALHRGFPGYRGTRAELHRTLETLRLLRNRIAHHEPIHARHLAADHQTIQTITTWVSPQFADWVASRSRVPSVLGCRPDTNRGTSLR
jgi:hypothetical protein